eukprot:jgi/Tetstr1/461942/TSEL_007020.t1
MASSSGPVPLTGSAALLPEYHPFRDTFVCDDALTCESKVECEYYTHHKKSVAWFNPDLFKTDGQQKLKNLDKQLARQALERMRGGHPQ